MEDSMKTVKERKGFEIDTEEFNEWCKMMAELHIPIPRFPGIEDDENACIVYAYCLFEDAKANKDYSMVDEYWKVQ